jgi:hypothetical protein
VAAACRFIAFTFTSAPVTLISDILAASPPRTFVRKTLPIAKEESMLNNAPVKSLAWMASASTSLLTRVAMTSIKRHTGFAKVLLRDAACLVLIVFSYALLANTVVQAGPITDPANDFRVFVSGDPSSYAGPNNPGLDVLSANVILNLNLQTLTFTSTMAGPISGLVDPNTSANLGSFSWGINHGYGSNNFADIGLPNVLFDAVLTLNPNGTGTYRGSAAPAGSVVAFGNTLTAVLPISFLGPPPQPPNAIGPLLPVTGWTYNLWPRSSIKTDGTPLGFGNAQIADFAPNAEDFAATVIPEPPSAVLLAMGLLGATLAGWRGRLLKRR